MERENWQVISTTSGVIKARIIEGRLEAEGIPVRLQYEPIGEIYAITVDGLGEVQILVPEQGGARPARLEFNTAKRIWTGKTVASD
jgi:hypothetical protein